MYTESDTFISKDIYNSSNNVFDFRNTWKLAYKILVQGEGKKMVLDTKPNQL